MVSHLLAATDSPPWAAPAYVEPVSVQPVLAYGQGIAISQLDELAVAWVALAHGVPLDRPSPVGRVGDHAAGCPRRSVHVSPEALGEIAYRRLATRFDRQAASVLAFLHLACTLICLRFLA